MADNWNVRNEEFTISDIRIYIKERLPKYMEDELDDHPNNYRSLIYEDWCDLLSTIKIKYEGKRAAVQMKNIASARADSLSESDKSVRILRKKRVKTGVLCSKKPPQKGAQQAPWYTALLFALQ